jgi:hypothetical protein
MRPHAQIGRKPLVPTESGAYLEWGAHDDLPFCSDEKLAPNMSNSDTTSAPGDNILSLPLGIVLAAFR